MGNKSESNTPEVWENSNEGFDPRVSKANKSYASLEEKVQKVHWHSSAKVICCVNSYPNGITISLHSNEKIAQTAEQFNLRFRDTRSYQLPDGKYFLYKKDLRRSLEKHFSNLHKKAQLSSTVVYFGTTVDPFAAFNKRFDNTTACLELFEKYRPQRLVMQTRSPMVIAALPSLKSFGDQAVVVMPIESCRESAIAHYTPGQPKISQRLLAAQGLRGQGIKVNLSASPILPYGDFNRDAWDFAELLDRYGDYITLGCLASGSEEDERILRSLAIAKRLEADNYYRWLRPKAYKALLKALSVIAPHKLVLPVESEPKTSQMTLFAA
jgi:DNA repair photolyase